MVTQVTLGILVHMILQYLSFEILEVAELPEKFSELNLLMAIWSLIGTLATIKSIAKFSIVMHTFSEM